MKYLAHIKDSFANLMHAKLRSFLAVLGIMVGTGAVVALLTTSQLVTDHAIDQFKTLGTDVLRMSIRYAASDVDSVSSKKFSPSDVFSIKQLPGIQFVAPYLSSFYNVYFHGHEVGENYIALTEDYFKIAKAEISEGRFIYSFDKNKFYCVLGSEVSQEIQNKTFKSPIGQTLQIGNWYFTIVGTLKPWEKSLFIYEELNKEVFIPIQVASILQEGAEISDLLISAYPEVKLDIMQKNLINKMQLLLPNAEVRFRSPDEIIAMIVDQKSTFAWLLLAIASISLLVGGIGVMNIMLVSVVERRKEIGIRMAIGAKKRDIHRMFLMEAVLLTFGGGLLGVIMGLLVTIIFVRVAHIQMHWHFFPLLLGFGVSIFVGLISGFYPAMRAARLDPVETLRSE